MCLDNESTDRMVFVAPYPLTKLNILQILTSLHIKPQIVENVDDFTAIDKETQIILVDLFSFDRSYRDLFSALRSCAPQAVLITLLDGDSDSLGSSVLLAGADMVINVNRADIELPPALRHAISGTNSPASDEDSDYKWEVENMEQKDESILKHKFSRRTFLKGSAATAVLVGATAASTRGMMNALTPNAVIAETEADEHTAHSYCHGSACVGCSFDVLVRDGNIVRTKARTIPGRGNLTRICPRGASWAHQVISPKRIKYPMKRVGERGEDKWEQITWDEAISTICTKIKENQGKYGKNSVAAYTYGTTATRALWPYTRLENLAEFCYVDICTDQAFTQAHLNNTCVFSGTPSYHNEEDVRKSKTIVLWGANRIEAWPYNWKFIADAIEYNGAKLVVVDPNYNTVASKAHLFVSVKPGTDGALAMAMIKYLDEKKLTADVYLQERSVAPFLVKEDGRFLRKSDLQTLADPKANDYVVWDRTTNAYGFASAVKDPEIRKGTFEVAGHKVMTAYDKLLERVAPYTLEHASEICGVPVATIKEFAKLVATNGPVETTTGFGLDHYTNAFGGITAVNTLRIVTGQVGWPNMMYGAATNGFTAEETNHPVSSGRISTFMFKNLLETGKYEMPGKTIEQQLKAFLVFAGNPVAMQPDRQDTIACLKKMDFVAVTNISWTDTAQYADIVLPACTPMEVADVGVFSSCIMYADQVITPKYESKSDFEIAKLIAEGLGFGGWFNFDLEHVLRTSIDSPQFKAAGVTLERLKEEKTIRLEWPTIPQYFTATGRLQFYIETMTPFVNFGQSVDMKKMCLPYWEPPYEAWPETAGGYEKNPLADKYPLCYHAGPRRYRVHTFWGDIPVLRELEGTEPTVRMNPEDAAKRGIKEGDYVRVYNDRGHAVVRAVFHTGIRPGTVDMDRGWQQHQYVSGHFQDLTSKAIVDMGCPNYAYHDALCEVEKA